MSNATGAADPRDFILTRVFDAPRELVFDVWTNPEHVKQWWGPKDFTNPVCEWDARPGGTYRVVMQAPDGAQYPTNGVFKEVVRPERIVMTDDTTELAAQWSDWVEGLGLERDADGNLPSIDSEATITFEEFEGKTKVTVTYRFESAAAAEALFKGGMSQGWSESLDKLAAVLATQISGNA